MDSLSNIFIDERDADALKSVAGSIARQQRVNVDGFLSTVTECVSPRH